MVGEAKKEAERAGCPARCERRPAACSRDPLVRHRCCPGRPVLAVRLDMPAIVRYSFRFQSTADERRCRLIHDWLKRNGLSCPLRAPSGGRSGFVPPLLAARMPTRLCRGFPCPCCHRYRLYKHIYTVQPKFPPWMLELSIRLVMRQDTQEEASKSGLALSRE